jgi:hypothetical protein
MPPTFFDPNLFRVMLDDPDARANFAAKFPTARALLEEFLDATGPALTDFPADGVTALQFTAFDNGPEGSARKLTMQSRFALHVKAWDRLDIDWRNSRQVVWEATACLRGASDTEALLRKLKQRGLVAEDVVRSFGELREMTGSGGLFGPFHQRKPGLGSRWTNVLVHVEWDGVDVPGSAVLVQPDLTGYEAAKFVRQSANGSPLGGKAVAQARTAFAEQLRNWATGTPS